MPDIIHRIGIKAPLSRVFTALTTAKDIAQWWTKDIEAEARIGAVLKFRYGTLGGFDMKVLNLEPSRAVKWECVGGHKEWIGTEVTFDLKQEDTETVVLHAQRNWKEAGEFMAHCSTKWAYFLISLKSFLENGKGSPYPDDKKLSSWG